MAQARKKRQQVRQPRSRPGEPADQVNYAALPGDVTALLGDVTASGPMQAFDHQAQHDLEASMSDGSTLSVVGIDVHHTATDLA